MLFPKLVLVLTQGLGQDEVFLLESTASSSSRKPLSLIDLSAFYPAELRNGQAVQYLLLLLFSSVVAFVLDAYLSFRQGETNVSVFIFCLKGHIVTFKDD